MMSSRNDLMFSSFVASMPTRGALATISSTVLASHVAHSCKVAGLSSIPASLSLISSSLRSSMPLKILFVKTSKSKLALVMVVNKLSVTNLSAILFARLCARALLWITESPFKTKINKSWILATSSVFPHTPRVTHPVPFTVS